MNIVVFRKVSRPFRMLTEGLRRVSEPFIMVTEGLRRVSEPFRMVTEDLRMYIVVFRRDIVVLQRSVNKHNKQGALFEKGVLKNEKK